MLEIGGLVRKLENSFFCWNVGLYIYPTMVGHLVRDYLEKMKSDAGPGFDISPREREILNLLANGYSSKEIAEQLVISPSTVHTHRSNLMTKLGLKTRRELTEFAREHGFLKDS